MATHQQQPAVEGIETVEEPGTTQTDELWVEIEIDRHSEVSCPVTEYESDAIDGDIQLVGDQCHATVQVDEDPASTRVLTTPIRETCTCNVVCRSGITPSDLLIEDGSLRINAFVESRDTLLELSARLTESKDQWHLRRLQTASEWSDAETASTGQLLEDVSLTEKQREVVQVAVSKGYYANPREASLSDLAAEVGVTRSALSQRLNAVEAKLIETLAAEL